MNFLDLFTSYPLWEQIAIGAAIILLFILIVRGARRWRARMRRDQLDPNRITIQDIDEMEGAQFEMYLYRMFYELGYEDVFQTKASSDFGADLVFTDRRGVRNVLQAKRYQEESGIGVSAVQEVYASMRYYCAGKAIVLASTHFTSGCVTLAGVNEVLLLDRSDLAELIRYFKSGDYESAMELLESEPEVVLSPWGESEAEAENSPLVVRLSRRER